jgi:glycosyltransferase involved in cell wall biosynthesis
MKNFYIVVNEKIFRKNKIFYCENKDIQSIANYFGSKYNLFLISRYSNYKKPFKLIKIYNVLNFNFLKIINLLIFFINLTKEKKKILIISITPFNFIIFFLLKNFFNCNFYLYLRSNGHEEYKNILGNKYVWIYDYMFKYITKNSEIISCHNRIYNNKCHLLQPSELNFNWKKKIKQNNFDSKIINILYVGRFKIEKGIYSLLDIFKKFPNNFRLTLAGGGDYLKINDNRIKIINFIHNEKKLINLYDSANILLLPSFTEAHPKVIDESLSRMRPVIIFDEIKYVINNRYGVFSVKRDFKELIKRIYYIKRNNKFIRNQLKKNKLPKKKDFLKALDKIIFTN